MTDTRSLRLGIVGLGTIASAVASSLARRGHSLTVSERGAGHVARLKAAYPQITVASNQAVIDASDLVFVGTTGSKAPQVLEALTFRTGQRVVSFMADISIEEVAALVAPARIEALMIPFPSIAQGGSPILIQPKSATLEALFGDDNRLYAVESDAALQAYMSAQAVLSPVIKLLDETQGWLADRLDEAGQGDALASEAFLRQLVGNSLLARPLSDGGVLAKLLADLSTPGGFNAELRDVLADAGSFEALQAGLDGLLKRFD